MYPGQVGLNQAINYPDSENNVHFIEKIAYKRQFNSSSYLDAQIYRTSLHDNFNLPWGGGAFGDFVENLAVNNQGIGVDYQNQLSNQHLITVGADPGVHQRHLPRGRHCAIAAHQAADRARPLRDHQVYRRL